MSLQLHVTSPSNPNGPGSTLSLHCSPERATELVEALSAASGTPSYPEVYHTAHRYYPQGFLVLGAAIPDPDDEDYSLVWEFDPPIKVLH